MAVAKAAEFQGGHRGLNRGRIERWIRQFPPEQSELAAKVLRHIDFIDNSTFLGMANAMVRSVVDQCGGDGSNLAFIPVSGAGSGAHFLARIMKEIRRNQRARWTVIELLDLYRNKPDGVDTICVIDDFCGSGGTIEDFWVLSAEPLILADYSDFMVGTLISHPNAEARLGEYFEHVHSARSLTIHDDFFAEGNNTFSESEKAELLRLCEATGVSNRFIKGFEDCGLLLSLYYGCPNNSIPILWHDANLDDWEPLFNRRTIG